MTKGSRKSIKVARRLRVEANLSIDQVALTAQAEDAALGAGTAGFPPSVPCRRGSTTGAAPAEFSVARVSFRLETTNSFPSPAEKTVAGNLVDAPSGQSVIELVGA